MLYKTLLIERILNKSINPESLCKDLTRNEIYRSQKTMVFI